MSRQRSGIKSELVNFPAYSRINSDVSFGANLRPESNFQEPSLNTWDQR